MIAKAYNLYCCKDRDQQSVGSTQYSWYAGYETNLLQNCIGKAFWSLIFIIQVRNRAAMNKKISEIVLKNATEMQMYV